MDFKEALKGLESSSMFKSWRKSNKDSYFSYAFKIPQEMTDDEWQLGFYNKGKDKITTFVIKGSNIEVKPEEEIFKKEGMKVNKVQLDKVKLTFDNALSKATEFQKNNFPKDKSMKTIAIMQNLEDFGNIWNITFVTEAFNTLNMKIDALTGKVLESNISSIFSFRKE